MNFIKKAVAPLAALTIPLASPSLAAVFSVDGTDYDITTITGSFTEHESILTQQIWWGDVNLADAFVTSVGFALGNPNREPDALGRGAEGPYFATDLYFADVGVQLWTVSFAEGIAYNDPLIGDTSTVWAVTSASIPVSAIPLPAGGLLLLSGFACVAGLRRKKNTAA